VLPGVSDVASWFAAPLVDGDRGVIPALDRVNLQFGLQYERVGVGTTPQTAAALEIRELQDLDSAIADF
jgi:hypothetical protein